MAHRIWEDSIMFEAEVDGSCWTIRLKSHFIDQWQRGDVLRRLASHLETAGVSEENILKP
jgi:hypothetical protein